MSVTLTATLANDSKNGGLKWTVSGGGTLTNTSVSGATYVAPASVNSATMATVTASSITDPTKSASVQITVNPVPAISTTSLPNATAGAAYSQSVNSSGGTGPFTWSISAGTLPPGLTLGSSTSASVTISGTPTGGNGTVTVKFADAVGNSATQALTITVNPPPALTITTASLPAGVLGTAYSQTLAATGGVPSYTWAVTTGTLPAGLTLNASTGVISGTPSGTFTGTTSFTVTLTDSQTPTHASKTANLSISVSAPALSVTTSSLTAGTLGTAYSQTLAATGGAGTYAWSISAGSLPAGLSLNASTGAITGTPTGTVTGAINFTVKVTDSETPTAQSATKALSITISAAPLSITTSSVPVGVVGSSYSVTLAAAGGAGTYTWAVTTGSLPAGLTLNASTGAITGTPTGSSSTFTVTVTDGETPTPQTANKQFTITVNPALTVTTTSLAAGVVGTAYNATLAASGGITPYTSWAVTAGSLPAGLSLNASTGAITGTPTGPLVGTISFTVTVTDSESPAKTASAALSITISAPALSVSTSSLPGGTLGTAYSQTLAASGGISPYTWSISSGSLPAGLTLNASTGAITGAPTGTVTGAINFTVKVTDSETPTAQSATKPLSITIAAAPLSVTTSSLPVGVVGSSYSATLTAAGGAGAYSWAVTGGSLPAGLTLNTSTGAITGTPTGTFAGAVTFTVTDGETPTPQTANKQLNMQVNSAFSCNIPGSLAAGVIGTAYNSGAGGGTGGIQPYSWSVTSGSLPAGLSLGSSTGSITGTPTGPAVGNISFTVTMADSESPAKTCSGGTSITISAPALNITNASLPAGTLGAAYTTTLTGTGGVQPYTWSVTTGSLPAGLTLNASTGVISGTPTTLGTSNFTITLTDSETPTAQTTTANLSISINNTVPVSVTTTSSNLPTGVVNTAYPGGTLQASGGISPYTWSITSGSLPAGLTLNTSTGAITGTPTVSGTSNFTAKVTDSSTPKQSATANLSITVNAALSITTTSLPGGTVSTAYSTNVNATGGIGPYTWSITSGSLPSGLSLGNNNGNSDSISGTPTATGTSNFTVTVSDSESPAVTANANLSITIGTASCTNNASLNGHYAMLLQGWTDSSAGEVFFGAAGSFVADGAGNITSGLIDANDPGPGDGPVSGTITGTYCLASNNIGTMNITLTSGGNSGSATLAFALQSNGTGNIIFYDTGAIQASGRIFKQTTTAFSTSSFSGKYSFGMIGVDPSSGNRLGMAGSFTANGTANLTSGSVDADVANGAPASTTFTSTNFSVAATGRGTVGINVTGFGTLNFAFYVVSASRLLMVNIDPTATGLGLVTGQVMQQSGLTGTDADLNGVSVITLQGSGPSVSAGLVTTDGSGATFDVTLDQNTAGTMTAPTYNGTYSVASNGRVTISGAGNHPPVLYMIGKNAAFVIGTDNSVTFGKMLAQSGGPFSITSASGNFYGGSDQPVDYNVSEEVDQVNLNAGTVTVTGDNNSTNIANAPNTGNPGTDSFTGSYSMAANGRGIVTGGGTTNGYVYLISPTAFTFLPYGDSNPKIQTFGQ